MMRYIISFLALLLAACGSPTHAPADRKTTITAITRLKNTLASNDAHEIFKYLPQEKLKEAHVDDYRDVVRTFGMLFANMDINALADHDTISKTVQTKGEPCQVSYSICTNASDTIVFNIFQGVSPEYAATSDTTADGIDLSSYCEHMTWYHFRLVNGRPQLVHIGGAD